MVSRKKEDGTEANKVLPYVIDLGSANGTFLNNSRIEAKRYYELKVGTSTILSCFNVKTFYFYQIYFHVKSERNKFWSKESCHL